MDETKQECINNEGWSLITDEETESLLHVLSNCLPSSLQIYNSIKYNLLWSARYPDVRSAIYHKVCKGQQSIISTLKTHENIVTVYSLNGPNMDLASAFKGNNIIKWSDGPVILCCIPMELCPPIEEAIMLSGKNVNWNTFNSFWLPSDVAKAIDVRCSEDMYLSKLDISHAATVVHHWPYVRKNSLDLVTQMINVYDSVGIFTKKDSILVSWVLNTYYGVGMLYTIKEYRRKGYGMLVLKQLVKSLGNKGINSTISTLTDNHAAKSLFMNIGFKELEQVKFIRVL